MLFLSFLCNHELHISHKLQKIKTAGAFITQMMREGDDRAWEFERI
jgi:hypothetical protein